MSQKASMLRDSQANRYPSSRASFKIQQNNEVKRINAETGSQPAEKFSATVLSVIESKGNYSLKYTDIFLHESYDVKDLLIEYRQAMDALKHNVVFVLNMARLGTTNKKGVLISIDFLKCCRFKCGEILNHRSRHTNSHSITVENLNSKLIYILEKSKQFVEELSKNEKIKKLLQQTPVLSYKFEHDKEAVLLLSDNLLAGLKENQIDLSAFEDSISNISQTSTISD